MRNGVTLRCYTATPSLMVIPKCAEVQLATNKVLCEGNIVLAFLSDPSCPIERVDDDTAMAPYCFFLSDWRDNEVWAGQYAFPATDKEFKKLITQISRDPTNSHGTKIEYGTRRRSPLWNNQLCPYIGVRRKNQPSAATAGPA